MSIAQKRLMIDTSTEEPLSIAKQCDLLGLSRSSYYYEPLPVSDRDLTIMKAIDRMNCEHPYYGYRRITVNLPDVLPTEYLPVNSKKVRQMMLKMNIYVIYPKKRKINKSSDGQTFSYLLRNVAIRKPRHVYSTDITYIQMEKGFMYLTAVIDWYSRRILSWRLSNTLNTDFCIEVVQEAFEKFGTPEIFNTDQGVQYTSNAFIAVLKNNQVTISMNGRGRCHDNIYCERFWRSIKQELIYINVFENGLQLHKALSHYFDFYNNQRKHQSLKDRTPDYIFRQF